MAESTVQTPPSFGVSTFPASDAPIKFAKISATTPASQIVVAAVTGKKIRVLAWLVVQDTGGTAETIVWNSGASGTALTGVMKPTAGIPIGMAFCPVGHFETAAGSALELLKGGTTIQNSGYVVYQEVE